MPESILKGVKIPESILKGAKMPESILKGGKMPKSTKFQTDRTTSDSPSYTFATWTRNPDSPYVGVPWGPTPDYETYISTTTIKDDYAPYEEQIDNLKKENEKLGKSLKQRHRDLVVAKQEIEKLKEEIETLREKCKENKTSIGDIEV